MRDRLRCPYCARVGTWKPHPRGLANPGPCRRWLCKWCGYYDGEDGLSFGLFDTEKGVWVLRRDVTPSEFTVGRAKGTMGVPGMIFKEMKVNPWVG